MCRRVQYKGQIDCRVETTVSFPYNKKDWSSEEVTKKTIRGIRNFGRRNRSLSRNMSIQLPDLKEEVRIYGFDLTKSESDMVICHFGHVASTANPRIVTDSTVTSEIVNGEWVTYEEM
jgi:hypothetical protein